MKRILIPPGTRYSFEAPVRLGPHTLLLRPREGHDLRIVSSVLENTPEAVLTWRRNLFENVLGIAAFSAEPVTELAITSRLEVELYETTTLNFLVEDYALYFPFRRKAEEQTALRPYLDPIYSDHLRLAHWLAPFQQVPKNTETFAILDRMNRRIHRDFTYEVREEAGVLSPTETLRLGAGSCRDLTALFLESCRRLGIAARFVSGYVHGPAAEAGGAASHAWAEVYLPGAGWKGFDPTNASVVGPDRIPVAVHRHPEAMPPVAGTFTGPKDISQTLNVAVQINQLPEA